MKAIFILVVLPIHVAFSQLKIIPTRSNQHWIQLFHTNDTKSNSSYLDQLRLIIGGSFHLNKNLSFQLSYNAQFNKLLAESKTYNFTNILWFTIRQTIDFTKNNEY